MNRFLSIIFILLSFGLPASCYEEDFIVEEFLSDKDLEKPFVNDNYNYQDTNIIPIRLKIIDSIKSEQDIYEGQVLKFKVIEDIWDQEILLLERGTICTANVETIINNGMNGIPASIILGNFQIPNIDSNKLQSSYEKYGMDLSLIVFPLKWALTILPPTGSLTNFIKGGHAKIKNKDIITIKYFSN